MSSSIFKSVWINSPEKGTPKKNPSFSATKFRNYFMGDPIIDYLTVYGEALGFQKDDKGDNAYMEYIMPVSYTHLTLPTKRIV